MGLWHGGAWFSNAASMLHLVEAKSVSPCDLLLRQSMYVIVSAADQCQACRLLHPPATNLSVTSMSGGALPGQHALFRV